MRRAFIEPRVKVLRLASTDIITTSQEPTERVQFGIWVENDERGHTDIFL